MFKFFKEKVKSALGNFSKKAEEEGEIKEEILEEKPVEEKKGFFARIKEKFTKKKEVKEEPVEEPIIEPPVQKKKSAIFDEGYVEVPEEIDKEAALKDIEEEYPEKKFEELKKEILEETQKKEDVTEAQEITKEINKTIQEAKEPEQKKTEEKIEEVVKKIKEKREKPSAQELVEEVLVEEKEQIKEPFEEEYEEKEDEQTKEKFEKEFEPKQEITLDISHEPKANEEISKKGFFTRIKEKITTTTLSEDKFDELFWDLELAMLENNVAVEVINKIKEDLKTEIVEKPIPRGKTEETVLNSLKNSVAGLFQENNVKLVDLARKKKPLVVCFIGINGSGKTTTIAKIAKMLQDKGFSVVMAAADTFRAAAIDQLQVHADKLGVKLIKHDYGADAAAVAYDAVEHAKAKGKDVVLIDTAGRLHSNQNLVDEMKKIVKVAKPDLKIFVGESITGNDCIEQAQKFNEAVELDGIILSKADIDEKGGAALSVSYVTGKPILYLGIGQNYTDLEEFSKEKILTRLGL